MIDATVTGEAPVPRAARHRRMYLSTATRTRGRRRTFAVLVVLGAIAGALAVAAAVLALAGRDALPARTVVGSVDVGRMSKAEAAVVLETAAARSGCDRSCSVSTTPPTRSA